mmetsp:Transcript_113234/g.259558  ORF Transcript_113234/g.259558 Transcript_113234/m.259558 type:complete len:325 (-) Transcript_113234:547-1521(-)
MVTSCAPESSGVGGQVIVVPTGAMSSKTGSSSTGTARFDTLVSAAAQRIARTRNRSQGLAVRTFPDPQLRGDSADSLASRRVRCNHSNTITRKDSIASAWRWASGSGAEGTNSGIKWATGMPLRDHLATASPNTSTATDSTSATMALAERSEIRLEDCQFSTKLVTCRAAAWAIKKDFSATATAAALGCRPTFSSCATKRSGGSPTATGLGSGSGGPPLLAVTLRLFCTGPHPLVWVASPVLTESRGLSLVRGDPAGPGCPTSWPAALSSISAFRWPFFSVNCSSSVMKIDPTTPIGSANITNPASMVMLPTTFPAGEVGTMSP